jgi:hypothetical protein
VAVLNALLTLNVSGHTEKKNGLTYLSWAWAWAEVLKLDPQATWEAVEFNGIPCAILPDSSAMVKVIVTISGHAKSCWLPVMDHKNKAIKGPDAFAINTALVRCLTKCISMHGLGLYIYAGEDLPEGPEHDRTLIMKVRNAISEHVAQDRDLGALQEWDEAKNLGDEFAKAVWSGLTSPVREKLRSLSQAAAQQADK